MKRTLRCELNLGSLCNFRCSYCFENGDGKEYKPTQVSQSHLNRYADLINYLKLKPEFQEDNITTHIYGGEPLLQLDKVENFIRRTKKSVLTHNIITNGFLVGRYKTQLRRLKLIHPNINIQVSFDFILQDETRQKNSYNAVRENIKWLYDNGLCRRIITTFSAKNFHRVGEVYEDFKSLQKDCPDLKCVFNIDRFGNLENIDEEMIRESLSSIPAKDDSFSYNNSSDTKRSAPPTLGCFYCRIFMAMCEDGSIYPGYEFLYEDEKVKELFYIGHIENSFETILSNHRSLIKRLPKEPKKECIECNAPCRVFPWRVVKDDLSQCWDMPGEGHCKIHKIFADYL